MIQVNAICKRFGDKVAVDNVSMSLKPGSIVGFIGPNGAGKSTSLKMMTGILAPDSGSISINGYDIQRDPLAAKQEFAYISDDPDKFLVLKGTDYIKFICDIYGVPEEDRAPRLAQLLDEFEMGDDVANRIETYSHGMRQKIHIIASLMHEPRIWIMDEPMTGLDPQSSYLLKQKMKEHAAAGNTVLFSTHVLEVAEKLCDEINIINKGRLIYNGTLEALKNRYPDKTLEEIFLTITESRYLNTGLDRNEDLYE